MKVEFPEECLAIMVVNMKGGTPGISPANPTVLLRVLQKQATLAWSARLLTLRGPYRRAGTRPVTPGIATARVIRRCLVTGPETAVLCAIIENI
jgi:hypothetical protein